MSCRSHHFALFTHTHTPLSREKKSESRTWYNSWFSKFSFIFLFSRVFFVRIFEIFVLVFNRFFFFVIVVLIIVVLVLVFHFNHFFVFRVFSRFLQHARRGRVFSRGWKRIIGKQIQQTQLVRFRNHRLVRLRQTRRSSDFNKKRSGMNKTRTRCKQKKKKESLTLQERSTVSSWPIPDSVRRPVPPRLLPHFPRTRPPNHEEKNAFFLFCFVKQKIENLLFLKPCFVTRTALVLACQKKKKKKQDVKTKDVLSLFAFAPSSFRHHSAMALSEENAGLR